MLRARGHRLRGEVSANLSLALGLGFALDVRHATDADHVAAVGAMLRREGGLRGALRTGALWVVGHRATVTSAGVAVIAFRMEFSRDVARGMDLVVAAMLLGLGAAILVALQRSGGVDPPRRRAGGALRPMVVGMVHGLAGSAGVALLALATIRGAIGAVAYLALFGVGTVAGMGLITALLGLPFALTARRSQRIYTALVATASVVRLATGCLVAFAAPRV